MAARTTAKGILPVLQTGTPGFEAAFRRLAERRREDVGDVEKNARKIVERVREAGDEALFGFIRKFDGAKLDAVEVTGEEWDEALE